MITVLFIQIFGVTSAFSDMMSPYLKTTTHIDDMSSKRFRTEHLEEEVIRISKPPTLVLYQSSETGIKFLGVSNNSRKVRFRIVFYQNYKESLSKLS